MSFRPYTSAPEPPTDDQMASSPSPFDPEMDRLRAQIALLRDRLASSDRVVEERSLTRLVAETPLADQRYQMARDGHLHLRRSLEAAQAALGSLILEREELGDDVRAG